MAGMIVMAVIDEIQEDERIKITSQDYKYD